MMNQNMPLSSLQLIMQMAANNPQLMANMMAQTGAQPPAVPSVGQQAAGGNSFPGYRGPVGTRNAATGAPGVPQPMAGPAPQAGPAVDPGLAQALAGVAGATVAPGPETLPAPSAPQPLQATGGLDGSVAQMMQMLMAAQQKPTERLSLGRAIAGG